MLADLLRSIRLRKILPLCVTYLNASLLGGPVVARELVLAFAILLSGCSLGMKLNVWTDRELDRLKKPELMEQLTRSQAWTRSLVAFEGLVLASSAALLCLSGAVARCAWLLLFVFLFNLYSFNFFVPSRGQETRLKIFWWGNLLTAGGGYFVLWSSGFGRATAVAAFCATFEYAMFLGECATDADEERHAGLRTLPAIVGRRGTVTIALGASVVAALLWLLVARAPTAELRATRDWYIGVGVATSVLLYARAQATHRAKAWDRIVDACFWTLRLGLLGILSVMRTSA